MDFSQFINFSQSIISENKFTQLGKCHLDGKDYRKLEKEQLSLFDVYNIGQDTIEPQKIRKAYIVGKSQFSKSIKPQSIWDLLFPLLQPPLVLVVSEEFDFYRPLFG